MRTTDTPITFGKVLGVFCVQARRSYNEINSHPDDSCTISFVMKVKNDKGINEQECMNYEKKRERQFNKTH